MQRYPLPGPAERSIRKLGRDISLARRRRRLTQASLAERAGIGINTLRRLEGGDKGVSLDVLARTLNVLGEIDRLGELLDSARDEIGLMLSDEQLPKRVRARTVVGGL